MAYTDPPSHSIRFSSQPGANPLATVSIGALRDYLEQCDNRRIPPDTHLFLSAADRLTRNDILSAVPLCINIIRIGTTLVMPNGERFSRENMNANLSLQLVLALATLDELTRQEEGG